MPIVEKIVKIRHPGTLRDFRWPTEMVKFGRYNLIYGWNGSGKTTISRFFRALEMRETPPNCEVEFSIKGRSVYGPDFNQATLSVRVFNRDFLSASVFPIDGGEIPPILVLGEDNVQKQMELDRLKRDLAGTESTLEKARTKKTSADRMLDQHCIDRARTIKDALRSSGSNPYNNYDKSDYRQCAYRMFTMGNAKSYLLDDRNREALVAQHRAVPKQEIGEIAYRFPLLPKYAREVSQLLETTVVSAAIQSLESDHDLSSWVHQGLNLYHSHDTDRCLFCDQTLPEGRLQNLEAHFSDKYDQFLNSIEEQLQTLREASEKAGTVQLPDDAYFYEDLTGGYKQVKGDLIDVLNIVKDTLDLMVEELRKKKNRVFESYSLDVHVPEVPSGPVEAVNHIVRSHNVASDNFEGRVKQARKRLANDLIADGLNDFSRLSHDVDETKLAVCQATGEVNRLKEKVDQLERDIVAHRRPAEELNEDLRNYLGHSELQLSIKDTGYAIMRNNKLADALSEGEITAIALLYFLKSLQDRGFNSSKGVVVLDDPVSSLDANALYLAFGFIRERTQDAAQLFILTHNFTLFRHVRNWFHHLKGQGKSNASQRPARFYMLNWRFNEHQRSSVLCPLDPLLEQYESEYHYLFARIYREVQDRSTTQLEESYVLPNMARRLLEGFLAFRQPQISGELWRKLRDVDFDEAKKLRILRFVHTHSHSDSIGEPEHDPSLLAEAPSVLRDILDFMKDQDAKHFEAMAILAKTPVEGDEEE